jgi:hypothetical protein
MYSRQSIEANFLLDDLSIFLANSPSATPPAVSEHSAEFIGCPISRSSTTYFVCLELRSLLGGDRRSACASFVAALSLDVLLHLQQIADEVIE